MGTARALWCERAICVAAVGVTRGHSTTEGAAGLYTLCGGGGFPLWGPIGAKPQLLYLGARGRAELCVRPTGVFAVESDGSARTSPTHTSPVGQSVSQWGTACDAALCGSCERPDWEAADPQSYRW